MIDNVLDLRKDGNEQPQFYMLTVKYSAVGAPDKTIITGKEADLREVLRDGGLATVDIDRLFESVR
jgi:hypothetical protein